MIFINYSTFFITNLLSLGFNYICYKLLYSVIVKISGFFIIFILFKSLYTNNCYIII
jgi:hypothetical protein